VLGGPGQVQLGIAEAGRRQLLVALGGCFVRGGRAQQRLQRTPPGGGDMSLRVIRALLGPPHIAEGGTTPRFVARQFQVALLNLKRPLPQLFDPRARLPEKLVPVCHRFMLTRSERVVPHLRADRDGAVRARCAVEKMAEVRSQPPPFGILNRR
jgi:hypothetical protein